MGFTDVVFSRNDLVFLDSRPGYAHLSEDTRNKPAVLNMFFIDKEKSLMGNVLTMCCGSVDPPFDRKVRSVIDPLVLSPDHEESERMKRILKKRFVSQVVLYEFKATRVGRRYNLLRFVVTVGSMILPTLQTIQTDPKVASIDDYVFWAAIGTSLTVMIANGMIQMFSFDKKYTIYHLAVEKMKAIGWQWLERSGKYARNLDGTQARYADNWSAFWNDLERVKSLTVGSVYGGEDHGDGAPPEDAKEDTGSVTETPRPAPSTARSYVENRSSYADGAMQRAMLHRVPSSVREESGNLLDEARDTQRSVEIPLEEVNEEMERHWQLAVSELPTSTRQTPANVPPLPLGELERHEQGEALEPLPEFGRQLEEDAEDAPANPSD
jgi:hypothetical protein